MKDVKRKEGSDTVFDRRMALLEEAFNKYHVYLNKYAFGLLRNWHDAENLTQDLWRHVLLHFRDEHIGRIGLLRRKTYQLFVNQYRKALVRGEVDIGKVSETESQSGGYDAFSEEEELELFDRFWAEFPDIDLTDIQRDCIWLHARFGLTYDEISQRYDLPRSTVGDWVVSSRQKINAYLKREEGNGNR